MKDFVLLIVVLAAFIYGYFLMEKLDKFLKENQSQKLISDSKLRIGFETPAIIDSIADLLEQFSSEYPNYELDLFYGSVSEIINGLGNNKLDFGFIIENSNDILKDEYCSLWVNMLIVLLLSPKVIALYKDYEEQMKAKKDPYYNPDKISWSGVDKEMWKDINKKYIENDK